MLELPAPFLARMKGVLQDKFNDFLNSYARPPVKSIRVNTLKISVEDFKKISPFDLDPVPWEECGFYVGGEQAGKTVLHAAGAYYVQEASAMSVAPLLGAQGGERVLDLCSAPGGKGTRLAQSMAGEGILFLNEINYSRAVILRQNVERMGIKNAVITCASPERLSEEFAGYFDKILVDAPCSGEGMFKKEPNAIPEWSEENVLMCAERQKRILDCADKLLKSGGTLVYSTCTFAPEEDNLQVDAFLKEHPNYRLSESRFLYPHEILGEGHYCAVLKKGVGEEAGDTRESALRANLDAPAPRGDLPLFKRTCSRQMLAAYSEWADKTLKIKFENLAEAGGKLYSLPREMPATGVQLVRAGVLLGEAKGGRFIPDHALAMCLKGGEANAVELDEPTALSYLRGLTFGCQKPDGWYVVTHKGLPLGWCKAAGGVAKNHLPKGLRI